MNLNTNKWMPSSTIQTLRDRQRIISSIRDFFNSRDYLEVDTPVMGRCGVTDPYLQNIKATFRGNDYLLQTSPEYHMKRLLAAGSGPIFQLARAFRDDELGRWHNPEFTMLEWYKLDVDHHGLMDEVDEFLQHILDTAPIHRVSYQQVFLDILSIDPLSASVNDFKNILLRFNLDNVLAQDEVDRDQYLFLLMSHIIEPEIAKLEMPVAIYDFPISQAALSKSRGDVGERFEIFYRGVELANGFHELTNAEEQRLRFMRDIELCKNHNQSIVKLDELLLQALDSGLPACSGVALGVDRLITIALKQNSIASTLSFDFSRC